MSTVDLAAASPPVRRPRRTEIQALRALAVTLVLLYHLWPNKITGGYVGVDVFFVISGYLITSHIVSGVTPVGRTFSVVDFYMRRVRRLLPAALTTIGVTLLGIIAFVPTSLWIYFGHQAVASTLYFENWALAHNAVDYSAPAASTSPFQHFWSLSVEEQFYAVWPLLIIVAAAGGSTENRRRRLIGTMIAIVTAVSLAYSIHETAADAAAAYFVTPTRMWEFGLGGLLAVSPRAHMRTSTRYAVSWLGFLAILVATVRLTGASEFPGWLALIPASGALAVIAAGSPNGRWSPARVFDRRPVQWLGDISYSVYLWHWPLILLIPYATNEPLGKKGKVVVIGMAIAIGWLSKKFVEDPFRADGRSAFRSQSRFSRAFKPAIVFATAACTMAVLTVGGLLVTGIAQSDARTALRALSAMIQHPPPCFGAAAMALPKCASHPVSGVVPAPVIAPNATFTATPSGNGCQIRGYDDQPKTCVFGDPHGRTQVALIGDSHAGQWQPALELLAEEHHWILTTYLKSGCPFTSILPAGAEGDGSACQVWNRRVLKDVLRQKFTAVFVSGDTNVGGTEYPAGASGSIATGAAGLARRWATLEKSGTQVVPIRDEPNPPSAGIFDPPTCVATHIKQLAACSLPRSVGLRQDPQILAARLRPRTYLVNLTRLFCGVTDCPAVIGGVLVYQNVDHITDTYARTLAPYFNQALQDAPTCMRASNRNCLPRSVKTALGLDA